MALLEPSLQRSLACPIDRECLEEKEGRLLCSKGHQFPIIEGVPVLLRDDRNYTIGIAKESFSVARRALDGERSEDPFYLSTLGISEEEKKALLEDVHHSSSPIDPLTRYLVGATNGILYKHLIGNLTQYPIPELRLPVGHGECLLDIGCNWGRWSIAAAIKGYRVVGIDPSLGAVLAAKRICQQMGVDAYFVVGDARFLPFTDGIFDLVFSYSVLQHFSKVDAVQAFSETGRVLKRSGRALIQMPNKYGVRCIFHQVRRGFKEPKGFEVRYWSLSELSQEVGRAVAPPSFSVDCFFGIGLQASDMHIMPRKYKVLIWASERLRLLSRSFSPLVGVADSVYFESVKPVRITG